MIEKFYRVNNAFMYNYKRTLIPGEVVFLKMPSVSPNARGVNDVGFAYETGIKLSATLHDKPEDDAAIWQEIQPHDEINKTVSYIKIENTGEKDAKVNIRALLN